MPYEFSIDSSSLDLAAWENSVLNLLAKGDPALLPTSTRGQLLPESYLLCDGGYRGVSIRRIDDGPIDLALPVPAGRADWRLARFLVDEARRLGGKVTDDEGLLAKGASDDEWERLRLVFWKMTAVQLQTDKHITFPGVFYLNVTAEQAQLADEERDEALAMRARRYAQAYYASLLKTDDGRILASYALIDTFASKRTTHVIYPVDGKDAMGPPVPINDLRAALGARCEDHGERWFFAAIDLNSADDASELADLNQSLGINPADHVSHEEGPSPAQQMQIIRLAPFVVFLLISGADGEIDDQEIAKFVSLMDAARESHADVLVRKLLHFAPGELRDLQEQASSLVAKLGPKALAMANYLGCKNFGELWTPMQQWLLSLGKGIATASGGGWFSSGISKEEQQMLDLLKQVLAPVQAV